MAQVAGVVQEIIRWYWRRLEIDCPVHERLASSNSKDDGIHVVDRDRLDDHGLGSHPQVSANMFLFFFTRRLGVDSLGKLRREAKQRIRGHVQFQFGKIPRQPGVSIEIRFLEVVGANDPRRDSPVGIVRNLPACRAPSTAKTC